MSEQIIFVNHVIPTLPLPRVDTLTGEWADYFETRRRKNPYYPPFTTTTPPLPSRHFEGLGRQAASNGGWESPRGGKGCAGRAQLRARSAYRREGVMTGLLWEGIWGGEEEREGGKLRWKEKSRLRKEQKKDLKESWWMKVGGWGKDEVRTNVRGRWRRSWRLDQCLYMWQTGRDQLMLGTFSSFSSAFSPSSFLILLRPSPSTPSPPYLLQAVLHICAWLWEHQSIGMGVY